MEVPSTVASGPSKPITPRAAACVLAGLVIVFVATAIFFSRSIRLEHDASLAENDAIARAAAAFVEAREEGHRSVLQSYAGRFRFRQAVKEKNRAEALVHLRQLVESFPDLDRPFLTDPAGVLWAAHPDVPELYGRSFAGREWYQGVSRGWGPYMSDVFPSTREQALVVVLAMPIRDLDGSVIGIIGSAQRLETVRRWLLPFYVPAGDLYVVDRKGQFVFHRTRTGPEHLADYAGVPVVRRLLEGGEGVAELENPVEREVGPSAYRSIPSLGWGVVVHREKRLAVELTHVLLILCGVAALVLTASLVALGVIALRNEGRSRAALAALQDKTRALLDAQEELVRKGRLAILGQLAGGISHELRNPLGVIKNSAYYLKMVLPEDDRARKHLQILEREVATANRIVTGLLDFTRVTPPNRAPTDLSALVREVLERTSLPESVTVAVKLENDLPDVMIDREQIGLVLGNLISNAAQAMPDGGALTIETGRVDGRVLAAVADTGMGISPDHLQKIFEPLFTTKARGIGLGLAVARNLADANGGQIAVESVPQRGSRFVVHFGEPKED